MISWTVCNCSQMDRCLLTWHEQTVRVLFFPRNTELWPTLELKHWKHTPLSLVVFPRELSELKEKYFLLTALSFHLLIPSPHAWFFLVYSSLQKKSHVPDLWDAYQPWGQCSPYCNNSPPPTAIVFFFEQSISLPKSLVVGYLILYWLSLLNSMTSCK